MYRTSCYRPLHVRILAIWLGLLAVCPDSAAAAEASQSCRIVYETPDGFFVDAGSARGVRAGDQGTVERRGQPVADVEVVRTSKSSALLRVVSRYGSTGPRVGDSVQLVVQTPPASVDSDRGSTTLKDPEDDEDFVPLLALPSRAEPVSVEPYTLFHGELRLSQLFQLDPETDQEYSITRLGSHGTIDRLGGTPWSFEWSGDVSYRDGDGLEESRDFRDFRLHLYRFSFSRRFDDKSFVRLGRFLPRELPAVGYLDGLQGEKVVNRHVHLGVMAGAKPTRERLDPSLRELVTVPYLTVAAGERSTSYYSVTTGLLGSLYEGDADRLALFVDQRLNIGPRLLVHSGSQLDFDVAMETRSGTRLTQIDLFADYRIASFLTLRAGFDHYERPDTQAERDPLPFEDDEFFDRGYWRYWVGATQFIPWNLSLDEEVAFTDSPTDDYEPRWRVRITRTGLAALKTANLTLSLYNFRGLDTDGYGGRLSTRLPFLDERLFLESGASFRFLEIDGEASDFRLAEIDLRANWLLSLSWSLYGGVTSSFGTDVERFLVDFGVSYRW